MRIRALGYALASAACLLLTACSHPQLMDPGMTESQVRTELGAPHAAVDTGEGTQRWVYSMQPFGQEVWWIEFDADGRIVRREEVLDRAHMALIKPGVSTKKDVWNLFGKCAQEYTFSLIDQTAWMYRFKDDGLFDMACWVQFDVNGVVKVSAKDLGTGREQNITITGSTNLSENEIQRAMADAAAYEAEDSRRKERLDLHNQAEVLAYKVDEALSKCKKELDRDEKNRIKTDVANLRRCLRKDKPEKMNETEEAALRQAKSQLEESANHLMMLYTSQQQAQGPDQTL